MPNTPINLDILNSFLQVSNWLTESLELDQLLAALVRSAVELVASADAGSLFLVDEANHQLVVRAVHNYGPEVIGLRLAVDEGVAGWVVKSRQSTIIDDFQTDPRTHFFPGQEQIAPVKSMVDAPLCVNDKVIGVLSFDNLSRTQAFNDEDLRIVQFFANNAALAIERTRLSEDLRQQNMQLQKLYQQAAQAARLKNEFLNCATHELRTPLCVIIGFSELMLAPNAESITDRQRQWLDIIHQSGQDMLNLINDIIDLSLLLAGQMMLYPERFQFQDMLETLLEPARRWAKDKPIELKWQLSPELPLLYLDRARLRQILLSLLSNAIKFTQQGAIQILAQPLAAERWQIEIVDSGIGIHPEHISMIFEEFGRVDNSTTRNNSGLGVGLAITKHLCQLMGGSISVESNLGQGSTFRIELPLATPPTTQQN